MKELIDYLKTNTFESLTDNFGIVVRKYDGFYNLSYTNYASPKYVPLVECCRGLIIDTELNVLARPFDRFYNYGENPQQKDFVLSNCSVLDKVDGSMVKIWYLPKEDRWCVGTRGTAFAEQSNPNETNYKKLIYMALGVSSDEEFNNHCLQKNLNKDETHIFELTSPFNKIIISYDGFNLHYLNSRNIHTGVYNIWSDDQVLDFGAVIVKKYAFNSVDDMSDFMMQFDGNDMEGFIILDDNNIPFIKLKSEEYVKMHYMRGDGLFHRNMVYMIMRNEQDEYLSYFPNDEKFLRKYIDTWNYMINDFLDLYREYGHHTPHELSVIFKKDFRRPVIIGMRKAVDFGNKPLDFLDDSLEKFRYKMFMNYFDQLGHKATDYVW